MTTENTLADLDLTLTDDPIQQSDVFLRAFNTHDGAIFDRLYRDDSISNLSGKPLSGPERTEAITELLAQKPRMKATYKRSYTTSDTMLVVADYEIEVPTPDGGHTTLVGSCTDVMTKDADGRWFVAIDRPVNAEPAA
ncbi:YybH family protein [Streptomyces sp. NPDC053431]|uniref:YybH family protein n=1 Tax=Streptomyces sp. NPDC053431 TaxID=3365703 RepID=UPI0037D36488